MKLTRIFKISAGMALAVGITACSSDYLDLKPEGTLDYEQALTNEEGATLVINGLCASMYKQWSAIDDGSLGFNGEPELVQFYGEASGVDYVSTYWIMMGGQTLLNWDTPRGSSVMNNAGGSQPAWSYCYQLISQANNLLSYTPKVTDESGETVEEDFGVESSTLENGYAGAFNPVPDVDGMYAFRYAQALTFRAHAYIHLLQIYCSRFEERRTTSGDWSLTVPLRLEYQSPESSLSCPLATWEDLVNQIYADLSQALELYESSGGRRATDVEPDGQVAMGLFSRIAMINHDWETARKMASQARKGYDIMTMDEYNQGFAMPNSEWMWSNSGESQGLYFWSFGALYACNGAYPCRWGNIGAGGINNELINEFTRDGFIGSNGSYDQRTMLYFSPKNVLGNAKDDFWNNTYCNEQTMDINSNGGQIHTQFFTFASNKYKNVEQFGWLPPYTYYGYPFASNTAVATATFGAQFKFWGTDDYSSSHFPFMRASEMLLTEAEAAYMLGDEKAADDLLRELNLKRYSFTNAGASRYNQTYSGPELLTAIKIFRRLELWGEGFHWFDAKRWNDSISRKAWEKGNSNSGNWPSTFAKTFPTDASNGWRYRIPTVELNYNDAIDRAQASYGYDW